VDADQGSSSNWEDRRSRFGFDAKLFEKKVEARVDFQSNDGFDDFYDGLVDAYIRWKPNSWLSITAGKTKPLIGQYDWLESTNTQPTFERSQIFNQLGINRATEPTRISHGVQASIRTTRPLTQSIRLLKLPADRLAMESSAI
jgi:hypothetical protein